MIGTTLITKKAIHPSMVDSSAIESYLKGIGRRYEQWRRDNALTDTIAAQQATFTFEQFVQTEDKQPNQQSQTRTLPLFQGIRDYLELEHVLLVGSPGVGKSSALWHCLDAFAKEELELSQSRIPVLVQLKGYRDSFVSSEDPSGLLALIQASIRPYLRLSISEIYDLLFQKRLVLLVDGLNEMPAGAFRTHLKSFREECRELEIPLICSTRELSGGDLGIQRKLEVQPLSSKETKRFLQECLPDHQEQVRQLLQRDNRELSRTPFVLWMLYHLLKETGTVAETLGESFRAFFRSHLRTYKEDAPVKKERRDAWNSWMEHLAFSMLNTPDPLDPGLVISIEDAEETLAERFGELNGDSSRIYELKNHYFLTLFSDRQVGFKHQLIQEYYAAESLLEKLQKEPCLLDKQPEQEYTHFQLYCLNYSRWTQVVSLMMGFLNPSEQVDESKLMQLASDTDLMLAANLIKYLNENSQAEALKCIRQKMANLLPNIPEWLELELLKTAGSRVAIPLLLPLLDHPDYQIRHHAHFTLLKIDPEAVPNQSLVSRELSKIQGIIKDIPEDSNSIDMLSVVDENNPEDCQDIVQGLKDPDMWVCDQAIRASENKASNAIAVELIKIISTSENTHLRRLASYQIKMISLKDKISQFLRQNYVSCLVNLLEDQDIYVRWYIASAIWNLNDKDSIPLLHEKLKSQNPDTSLSAALPLGRFGCQEAASGLIKMMDYENLSDHPNISEISYIAAYALGQIEGGLTAQYLPELFSLLATPSGENCFYAINLIQSRCGFYNYRMQHQAMMDQEWFDSTRDSSQALFSNILSRIDQTTQEIEKRTLKMASEPKNDLRGANFNAPVNFGDNPTGDFINTQNNYVNDPEVQGAISDLEILLSQLQVQYPSVNTESEALAIIDAEFTEIQQSQSHKLVTLRKQLLNPERHLQAAKAAAGEVAKHYLEDSVLAKALITYFDKLSEEPNHGA